MSTTTNAPVVVVTEEKKRRKGLLWVAGGTALLLGGSTFALWSASAEFDGGSITSGDLNLVASEDGMTFWDVSADRADATIIVPGTDGSQKGHAITDTDDWRMVPGDKVAAAFDGDVTLSGDNMVGRLSLDGFDTDELLNENVAWTYEVYLDGVRQGAERDLPVDGLSELLYLEAPRAGQAAGGSDANANVLTMTETTQNIAVVVYGEFDVETPNRDDVNVTDTLGDLTLNLNQVRDTGEQFLTPPATEPED